jgi:hypothetical protein
MPIYAIILSSLSSILLIVGVILLLLQTFEADSACEQQRNQQQR